MRVHQAPELRLAAGSSVEQLRACMRPGVEAAAKASPGGRKLRRQTRHRTETMETVMRGIILPAGVAESNQRAGRACAGRASRAAAMRKPRLHLHLVALVEGRRR